MNGMSLKLLVGLGNPDKKLLKTRHNVGFWFIDALLKKLSMDIDYVKKYDADLLEYDLDNQKIFFMKPMSYVNNSGHPIKKFIKNRNIRPSNILIIYDDLDLNVGGIRLKFGGSSGGHNGLNSIINEIKSPDFWRLRLGIGKPNDRNSVIDYVLGIPTKQEILYIDDSINKCISEFNNFISGSPESLMNKLNKRES